MLSCDSTVVYLWSSVDGIVSQQFEVATYNPIAKKTVGANAVSWGAACFAPQACGSYVVLATTTRLVVVVHTVHKEDDVYPLVVRSAVTALCRRGPRIAVGDNFGNQFLLILM